MKKISVILVCLFCLSGCSTKLAYNFLDFLFSWYVSKYVSLEKEQKSFFKEAVDEFHSWHRTTQLDRYATYIETLTKQLENGNITGEWIHKETDELQIMLDASVNYLKPTLVELVSSFSDEQAEELLENLAKNRKKYKKKYIDISDKKRRSKRKAELIDNIGPFFGNLTESQKAWIEEWLDEIRPYETLTLKQQEVWAEKVKLAMENRHDETLLTQYLDDIMFYRTDDWDPQLQEILDHNQEISYDLIARLVNSQTQKQRKKMFKKLESYRRDFIDLSKES